MSTKRSTLISGNWKMNENHFESLKLIQELAALLRAQPISPDQQVSLHPPFTSLRTVQTAVETDHLPITLGAQTCHFEDRGAYTGEISAEMLAKLNVVFVLAGHSERRAHLGETDEIVARKVEAIFRNNMRPILCVGETPEEREDGLAEVVVERQVRAALGQCSPEQITSCVLAYEPLWAIGTGLTASPQDAQRIGRHLRAVLREIAGPSADETLIQYGGSVTPENAAEFLACPDIDGLLVGGASLDATKFVAIIHTGE